MMDQRSRLCTSVRKLRINLILKYNIFIRMSLWCSVFLKPEERKLHSGVKCDRASRQSVSWHEYFPLPENKLCIPAQHRQHIFKMLLLSWFIKGKTWFCASQWRVVSFFFFPSRLPHRISKHYYLMELQCFMSCEKCFCVTGNWVPPPHIHTHTHTYFSHDLCRALFHTHAHTHTHTHAHTHLTTYSPT